MRFRTPLPLTGRLKDRTVRPAADGQNGCIQKVYREWRFSGDGKWLASMWPDVKQALEFVWLWWDRDRDGVMEDRQHNTMDVDYFGPNAECNFWYLGALRAGAEMAKAMAEDGFAAECQALADRGAAWMDAHLFNGEYYSHIIYDPDTMEPLAAGKAPPNFQIGDGCMADQFIGQVVAYGAGLGALTDPAKIEACYCAASRAERYKNG